MEGEINKICCKVKNVSSELNYYLYNVLLVITYAKTVSILTLKFLVQHSQSCEETKNKEPCTVQLVVIR